MVKKQYSVYIDEYMVSEMKRRKISISHACNETMKAILSEDFINTDVAVRLSEVDNMIMEVNQFISAKEIEINSLKIKIDRLNNLRQTILNEYEESLKVVRLSHLIRDINKSAIALNFDITSIQTVCADVIKSIEDINPHFNLKFHIDRFKAVITS